MSRLAVALLDCRPSFVTLVILVTRGVTYRVLHAPPSANYKLKLVGIRRVTSRYPLLVFMMVCCKSFLKSTVTDKFKSILDRMTISLKSFELQLERTWT